MLLDNLEPQSRLIDLRAKREMEIYNQRLAGVYRFPTMCTTARRILLLAKPDCGSVGE